MPIYYTKQLNTTTTLSVWHITETKDELIANINANLLKHEVEKHASLHWLASRILLSIIFTHLDINLYKNENNKPQLIVNNQKYYISITHSNHYAAVIISSDFEVGLDLEKNDNRINRVARKFINTIEEKFAYSTLHKTLIWSAKETLYKIYGKKEVDFKENLIVHSFEPNEEGVFIGEIEKDEVHHQYEIHYQLFDDMVLTYSLEVFNKNNLQKTIGLKNIEHIGIAVKNAAVSVNLFNALFNTKPYKTEAVESEFVNTIFYQTGETKIELLEPTSSESAIAKFIEKKGEGMHHIAFAVNNIYAEMDRLKNLGFVFINAEPKHGADNKLIAFLHPKSTNGILVELCQERV